MQEVNVLIFLEILLEGFNRWVPYEVPKTGDKYQ